LAAKKIRFLNQYMYHTYIDSHTHLYDEQFGEDRKQMIQRAIQSGVSTLCMPNCDENTFQSMIDICQQYPTNCFPMIGLHPCYVNGTFKASLDSLYQYLDNYPYVAVGEIGLDYYWDKTFIAEQKEALHTQIEWALSKKLPVVLHTRDSIQDTFDIVSSYCQRGLTGVFHCFTR
jgi:Mg-dependent DNase